MRGRVFVYGTLLPDELRWPVLADVAVDVAEATAAGRLWDTRRGFPAAVFGDRGTIPGVVVTVSDDRWDVILAELDAIEGEGTLYRRLVVETSVGPATSYEWLGPTDGMRLLPRGWHDR